MNASWTTRTRRSTRLLSVPIALAVAAACSTSVPGRHGTAGAVSDTTSATSAGSTPLAADASAPAQSTAKTGAKRTGPTASRTGTGAAAAAKQPQGVTDKEIKVVYYWNDRVGESPYLNSSGSANLDEGDAFTSLVNFINKHANGGATFMGFPFDLHGRTITPKVIESGKSAETYGAAAQQIIKTEKPFAAQSSHGSASTYMCDALAKAGIFNVGTYDLSPNVLARSGGYCYPAGLAFESQVQASVTYLATQAKTPYTGQESPAGPTARVYGIVYADYPGLSDFIPTLVKMLRTAGLNIADVEALPVSLTDAQPQAPQKVLNMKSKHVNTVISPDAGAPLNFTHAAQAAGFNPDWFVWPCSGQDATAMVRLYDAGEWKNASGLTCFDRHFDADLTNDSYARSTEWWKAYQEGRGQNVDPPAPTPYVYAGLAQLLVGLTNAGRDLTVDSFRAGLKAFQPYRYDTITGRTSDASSVLLTFGAPDASVFGDVATIRWDPSRQTAGAGASGAYVFTENTRHLPADRS